jgi:magnesium transporter
MSTKKETVIVADDDPRLLRLVQYNLQQAGYRVVSAPDGNKALRLAETEGPDLILLDIRMPLMDGLEVCRRVRNFSTDERTRFILQIFLKTTLLFLRYLRDINRVTDNVQKDLHRATRNEQLIRLLNLEKCLVYITTSLRSNAFMMEKFHNASYSKMDAEDQDLLDEVIIENKQAMEMGKIYSEILSGLMDAFASLISNNLNTVVKTLTTITIILMIPTLVASFYGMNVNLPLQSSPDAFLLVVGFTAFLCTLGIVIFWRGNLF